MNASPLILLVNDDGVHAPGILALQAALAHLGEVFIVAPDRDQSSRSHSITLHRPLRHCALDSHRHSVDGTPVDCVYVALNHANLLPRRPTLLVSGINEGSNLGNDVFYSGTVAAAREGALRGIPSVALSLSRGGKLDAALRFAEALVRRLLSAPPSQGQTALLNVNLPLVEPKGVRATRLGRRIYEEEVAVRRDPRGGEYFWIGGSGVRHDAEEGSDTLANDEGFASITPLWLTSTCEEQLPFAAALAESLEGANA